MPASSRPSRLAAPWETNRHVKASGVHSMPKQISSKPLVEQSMIADQQKALYTKEEAEERSINTIALVFPLTAFKLDSI